MRSSLLPRCWRIALGHLIPVMAIQVLLDLSNDGWSWHNLAEAAKVWLIWPAFALLWAAAAYASLTRHARGTGIRPTAAALDETQRLPVPGTDRDRILTALRSSERATRVTSRDLENGGWEVDFLWRPHRIRREIPGLVSCAEGAGGAVRLETRAGYGHMGAAGLRVGTAFMAACRVILLLAPDQESRKGAVSRVG